MEQYNLTANFLKKEILSGRKIKEKKLLVEVSNSIVKMSKGNEDTCKVVFSFELCI